MGRPKKPGFLVAALLRGLVVLLPILLVFYLLKLGIDLVEGPASKLSAVLPFFRRLGPLGDLLIASLLLGVIAFIVGSFATSGPGRSFSRRLRSSPLSAIPPLSFIHGVVASVLSDEDKVSVVLVPSDQGRTLAFVFGPLQGDPICIYVPSAPNWRSGSISFARREDIQETCLSFNEAVRIIMMLGHYTADIDAKLNEIPGFRIDTPPLAADAAAPVKSSRPQ